MAAALDTRGERSESVCQWVYLRLRGAVQTLAWRWQCGLQSQMTGWMQWGPVSPAGWWWLTRLRGRERLWSDQPSHQSICNGHCWKLGSVRHSDPDWWRSVEGRRSYWKCFEMLQNCSHQEHLWTLQQQGGGETLTRLLPGVASLTFTERGRWSAI